MMKNGMNPELLTLYRLMLKENGIVDKIIRDGDVYWVLVRRDVKWPDSVHVKGEYSYYHIHLSPGTRHKDGL